MISRKTTFGQLEQAIMAVVWERSPATGREVVEQLDPDHRAAYTTVLTVMNRLVKRGCLKRRSTDRGIYKYAPAKSRHQAARAAVRQTLDTLVDQYGSAALTESAKQAARRLKKVK